MVVVSFLSFLVSRLMMPLLLVLLIGVLNGISPLRSSITRASF